MRVPPSHDPMFRSYHIRVWVAEMGPVHASLSSSAQGQFT